MNAILLILIHLQIGFQNENYKYEQINNGINHSIQIPDTLMSIEYNLFNIIIDSIADKLLYSGVDSVFVYYSNPGKQNAAIFWSLEQNAEGLIVKKEYFESATKTIIPKMELSNLNPMLYFNSILGSKAGELNSGLEWSHDYQIKLIIYSNYNKTTINYSANRVIGNPDKPIYIFHQKMAEILN